MGGFGVLYIEMRRVVDCVLWLSGGGVGVLFVCVVCYCVVWMIAGVACLLVIMVWCVIAVCLCLTLLLSRYCLFVVATLLVMFGFWFGWCSAAVCLYVQERDLCCFVGLFDLCVVLVLLLFMFVCYCLGTCWLLLGLFGRLCLNGCGVVGLVFG